MISAIKGKLARKDKGSILVDAGNLTYEVLVPLTVINDLKDTPIGGEVCLVTFHYYMGEPSRSFPILIGFMNDIEREFFEKFITVSGVGPKAAIRAINKPISEIAKAIGRADLGYLKSLPGIGEQRAREIIAKLQSKIGKFALIKDGFGDRQDACEKQDIASEAVQVLMQLQYKRHQAQDMVEQAVRRNPKALTSEELLNEVYKQRG
ncbi:MAG: Holliday junction branch migration protein RuvA [Candidatus Omnitrophota bacterium]|jgi:Holliday junction DNA helicase RuvA